MDPWFGLTLAGFLVVLNGFFVATEFAIVKVRPTRLAQLVREGVPGAKAAQSVVARLDEFLSATQLGITLASLGLGWIGEPAFSVILEPLLAPLELPPAALHATAFAVAFSVITFLHIVLGELAPKSLAIQRAEQVTILAAWPMRAFRFLFWPFIASLNGIAALVLRSVGLQPTSEHADAHTEEELRLIVGTMRARGGVSKDRLDLVERALALQTRTARDLMVARGDVAFLRITMDDASIRAEARRTGHTRYPVIDDELDEVIGILHVKDLFLRVLEPLTKESLKGLLREPFYIPEAMRAEMLLREFRKRKQHLAIVVDEYGGTAGVVTVEDVVAAVVGELQDEFARWGPSIVALPGGAYDVDPATPIEEFGRHFGCELREDGVTSIGGLLMIRLDRVPVVGDRLRLPTLEISVEEMKGPKPVRLSVRRLVVPPAPGAPGASPPPPRG